MARAKRHRTIHTHTGGEEDEQQKNVVIMTRGLENGFMPHEKEERETDREKEREREIDKKRPSGKYVHGKANGQCAF